MFDLLNSAAGVMTIDDLCKDVLNEEVLAVDGVVNYCSARCSALGALMDADSKGRTCCRVVLRSVGIDA